MLRRIGRVLLLILRPIRPSSDLVAAVQVFAVPLLPFAAGLLPFLSPWEWTWTNALLVALAGFVLLSVRGDYQLQQDYEALLGGTPLENVIGAQIKEGNQLLARLKRKKNAEEVPQPLVAQITSWTSRTIRDINEIAPDVAEDLFKAPVWTGSQTRDPKDQISYVKSLLRILKRLGRELRGSG